MSNLCMSDHRSEKERNWIPDSACGYEALTRSGCIYFDRYDDLLNLTVARANLQPGYLVLDLGTGTGELAYRIAESKGCRVMGLDPSAAMIERARQRTPHLRDGVVFTAHAQPFLDLPYPAQTFDAVVSTMAFHHVRPADKERAVEQMVRVLRPGSRVVLGDVFFSDDAARSAALVHWANELEDEYFGTLDAVQTHFARFGLSFLAEPVGCITWVVSGTAG